MAFEGYRHGEAGFRRVSIALFAGSFASFGLLYCLQPLLPEFTRVFDVSPAVATMAISMCTIGLGLALLVAGPLSDAVGRTVVMRWSLVGSSVVTGLCAIAPDWPFILAMRALTGVVLAGFPAVAMAYLREEVHASSHARATGLYVGGNALGGLSGRLVTGTLTEFGDWRLALAGTAAFTMICTVVVLAVLPASRNFTPGTRGLRASMRGYRAVLGDRGLLGLYVVPFVVMGAFVAMFNIAGFRLEAAPYLLPVGIAGLIYFAYPIGSISSAVAGRVADRVGPYRVIAVGFVIAIAGMALTFATPLWLFITAITIVVIGFFAVHAVASAAVATRAYAAGRPVASAAAIYLFAYYLGSSVFGTAAGSAWRAGAWPAVGWMDLAILGVGLAVAIALWVANSRSEPVSEARARSVSEPGSP
ncbi:MFS transporter [Epidermidibacterium keratini]|uniref:MFS transporter n=1 Tax=Epidermidibacterium keratini TaxID=1891644 RepID=A0A7L4YQ46_9ACTN|nr:MFS transporter [Epidermidibacterium keratini]